ncbi:MAG: prolipoprotein diacylglyceryl transferase family protein [Myxococcota bacterium]
MSSLLLIPWFRVEPFTLELGGLQLAIAPFRITVGLAFLTIIGGALLFARRNERSPERVLDVAIMGSLFALPAALLFYWLQRHFEALAEAFPNPASLWALPFGWSSYGGMVGGLIGAMVWKWRTRASLLAVGDCFAFALPFGLAVARFGCFLAKDHPGRISTFFLAVEDYQTRTAPFYPRHDLGLYESMTSLAVGIAVLVVARRPRLPGFYVALVATLLPLLRFILDFLRAGPEVGGDVRYGSLTLGQWVSGSIVLFGLALLEYVERDAMRRTTSQS